MSALIIPEITLLKTLESILKVVKDDWTIKSPTNVTETYLYKLFKQDEYGKDLKINTFNYFDSAVDAIAKKTIPIYLGYNMSVSDQVAVHILLPSDNGRPLNIGAGEGYQPDEISSDSTSVATEFSFTTDTVYQIMVSGSNSSEVVLVYHFLRAGLLSLNYHLELSGLRSPKFGGQDINFQSDLVPPHIFHRSILLSFFYEVNVPDLFYKAIISGFAAAGIMPPTA